VRQAGNEEVTDIRIGDCLQVMPTLPENSVDSIITDPPYGLDFMGKEWDHGVPGVEFWQAALRVAKPGAILMAFGGTRTFHRLACAIEDAGWELRDTMCWLYGSGFPKSLDISKAIDKAAPREGMFAGFAADFLEQVRRAGLSYKSVAQGFLSKTGGITGCAWNWAHGLSVPTLEQWHTLKSLFPHLSSEWLPLIERVEAEREVVGQSPRSYRVGIPLPGTYDGKRQMLDITTPATDSAKQWQGYGTALKPAWEPIIVAMKPLEGTYAENAQKWGVAGLWIEGGRIGGIGGVRKVNIKPNSGGFNGEDFGCDGDLEPAGGRWPANLLLDEESAPLLGGASRFFYTAKASASERNAGLEDCEPQFAPAMGNGIGGKEHDPETATKKLNIHPTVKPVDLMRYLCKLTKTPTGGVVLDPFMGSGTTGIACILEHRDFIGIEIDEKYAEIAKKRIADMEGPLFQEAA
jgi:DNA modification methylase